MKTLITIFILHLALFTKSQSPIVNINGEDGSRITGAYYKDVDGLLTAYEGTYIYTNGNTILKMVLVQKVQQYNGRYYEDLIIGEYQYIKNGVEKVNTLSQLNTVYNDQRSHNIDGNTLISNINRRWRCPLCLPGEKRLSASIRDAATDNYANIFMRRTIENGQQLLKIKISNVMGMPYHVNQGPPPEFSLPLGEFIFVKQ
jgi:hypothetical protein